MRRSDSPENLLIRKMECFVRLSDEDKAALDKIWNGNRQSIAGQRDIVREGDPPRCIRVILKGWACRYKLLEDGRRQITSFFLPGDMCDLNIFVLSRMDHSVRALTPVQYVTLSPFEFEKLTFGHPRLLQALWWETLVNAAIQREWTVNLGQRSALERLAHLLCEIHIRLQVIGMVENDICEFPVTQLELADTLGLTAVHVSRTLKELRTRNLIQLRGHRLEILDFHELCRIAMFDSNYLHLEREETIADLKADCA
jgi:CRP-like cAMP-binding protein